MNNFIKKRSYQRYPTRRNLRLRTSIYKNQHRKLIESQEYYDDLIIALMYFHEYKRGRCCRHFDIMIRKAVIF